MNDRRFAKSAALLAALSSAAMIVEPSVAGAQPDPESVPEAVTSSYDQDASPPPGQNVPQQVPSGAQGPSGPPADGQYAPPAYGTPNDYYVYQQQYHAYRVAYAHWAAENCYRQHANNTAAGAFAGAAVGAILGASLAGWAVRGAWALFGGFTGAALGAAIGSSASPYCPVGYAVRAGAPPFYYGGPAYPYAGPAWGPGPYYRGGWVRRPYGYGYRPAPYPYYHY